MAYDLLPISEEWPMSPPYPAGQAKTKILDRFTSIEKRMASMLHPLRLISQQALFGVIFLIGVMFLCVSLLSPIVLSALVFGY